MQESTCKEATLPMSRDSNKWCKRCSNLLTFNEFFNILLHLSSSAMLAICSPCFCKDKFTFDASTYLVLLINVINHCFIFVSTSMFLTLILTSYLRSKDSI